MKQGDYILISALYLYRAEGFTTHGGKKKWYRVQITRVNDDSFEFSDYDMKYKHKIMFKNTHLYKKIKQGD